MRPAGFALHSWYFPPARHLADTWVRLGWLFVVLEPEASVGARVACSSGRARVSHAEDRGGALGPAGVSGLSASLCRRGSPLPQRVLLPAVLGSTSRKPWGSALSTCVETRGDWSHHPCLRLVLSGCEVRVPGDGCVLQCGHPPLCPGLRVWPVR